MKETIIAAALIIIGIIAYFMREEPIIAQGGKFLPRYDQQFGN